MVADRSRDRGQLILIGCLSVALVVIGIGLVINTTLYTESASPALSNVQVEDAETFNLETRRGTRSLVHRLNHGDPDRSETVLNATVTGGVENYSKLLAVSYARTEPAAVTVSYDHGNSKIGTRIVQQADGEFDDALETELAEPDQRIGWFLMNVNVSESGENRPFTMAIEGNESESVEWEILHNETGPTTNLTVRTSHEGNERVAHCNPRQNRILIDGMTGSNVSDGCVGDGQLFGLESLEPPHEVTAIDRESEFFGQWELVTNETDAVDSSGDIPACNADPDQAEACHTPAVWTANVTASYDGRDATFVRDRNVSIYGGSP